MMKPPVDSDHTISIGAASAETTTRAYLLVMDGSSSSMFSLPTDGEVMIGRGTDADLRIDDASVSRRHAKLIVTRGAAKVLDLGSHNGTRLNGERLDNRARPLTSGDVVSIGAVPVVVHAARQTTGTRPLLDLGQLRQRLEEEIERALSYERSLSVVAIALGTAGADHAQVPRAIEGRLRLIDVAGWLGYTQLLVMLPELEGEAALNAVLRLVEALGAVAPAVKAGLATCPDDGCDVDTLLSAARAAAAVAPAGEVSPAGQVSLTHRLADRTVVLADPAMIQIYELLRRLAASDLPVLISGETGTGKENAAFAVHHWSPRSAKPFVALNCAALQDTLVESELFGYEKGAFSGAVKTKPGLLESAGGGTVFLDEIGDLPASAQAKLLRALETKRITRLGDLGERPIDIRIVAATHRRLEEEVTAGRFRRDLLFRLNTAMVILPPLRERPREVVQLARSFLDEACRGAGRQPMTIAPSTMRLLAQYEWPGNVRELKNTMDYVAAAVTDERLEVWHLPARLREPGASAAEEQRRATPPAPVAPSAPSEDATPNIPEASGRPQSFRPLAEEQRELERRRMSEALAASGSVQTRAAELIGMPLRTFVKRMKEYGLGAGGRPAK